VNQAHAKNNNFAKHVRGQPSTILFFAATVTKANILFVVLLIAATLIN
jgi:hypothetical protein